MSKFKSQIRAISLCMAFLLCVIFFQSPFYSASEAGSSSSPSSSSSSQDQASLVNRYDELTQQIKDTQEQIKALEDRIKSGKSTATQAQQRKAYYEAEAALTAEQIVLLQAKIAQQEIDIAAKQAEIVQKQKELDDNDQLFRERLVAIYKMNDSSPLSLLLTVDSYSDFLIVSKNLETISQHDTDLLDLLEVQRTDLETAEGEMQDLLVTMEADKTAMDNTLVSYQNSITQAQAAYDTAIANIASDEATLAKEREEYASALAEMESVWKSLNSTRPTYVGGELQWPCPSYNGDAYITSHFGWRILYGKQNHHGGMDISGRNINGTPVVAANAGDVVKTVSGSNVGYGNYVIIDHGNGVKTLYGHCSSVAVRTGAVVKKGDTIAYVGSTGNSTGPHLHFELRINDVKANPYPYLTGQKSLGKS